MIGWNVKLATKEKWPEIKSEAEAQRKLHSREKKHKVERITVNVGRKVNVLMTVERVQNTR